MFFEFFVGYRYLKSKKEHRYISFNTYLSVFMVALGVFTLVVVVSVMEGFQQDIREKLLSYDYHLYIKRIGVNFTVRPIPDYKRIYKLLIRDPMVIDVTPEYRGEGIIRSKRITGVEIRGIMPKKGGRLPKEFYIGKGKEFKGKNSLKGRNIIFLGRELALFLGVDVGDKVDLIVPRGKGIGTLPGIKTFRVRGIFKTGYYPFDEKLAIISLKDAQRLFGVKDVVNGIGIKIRDVMNARRVAAKIARKYRILYVIETWEDIHRNLYSALNLEKLVMIVLLFLIIVASALNITGTLVMVVLEKRRAIGILKAMGAKNISIIAIFMIDGFFIGFLGTLIGVVLGLYASLNLQEILVAIENLVNFIGRNVIELLFQLGLSRTNIWIDWYMIPSGVYYIDKIPTVIDPFFVVSVSILSIFLSVIAAIIPGINAARLKPAEIIRYE